MEELDVLVQVAEEEAAKLASSEAEPNPNEEMVTCCTLSIDRFLLGARPAD